jgi:N-acetylneuraminic acid mutarotase
MTHVRFVLRGLPFASSIWLTALLVGAIFLSGLGCALDARPPGGDELRFRFPGQAAQVLLGNEGFVAVDEGFALASTGGPTREIEALFERRGGLQAALPASGEGKVRFHLPGGFEIGVREIGAEGEGAVVERAVAYRRQGGTSFWSAVDAGYEEWLLLDAGVANGGSPVAAWEVDGATLRQQGDAVEVVDDAGAPRLRVTAPAAYASGGRPVEARLEVRGATIALWVDAGGEEVLVDPVWAPTGAMSAARAYYTATPLGNGQVLIVGGINASSRLGSAELYDAVSDTWWSAGTLATARYDHTATLLGNGKVLVVGGGGGGSVVHTSAELYDPASNTWTATGALAAGRSLHTATLLGNGKVLVAGGHNGSSVALATAELYDPSTGVWSPASTMGASRSLHTATLLGNGKVLVAGGQNGSSVALATAELYDPSTGAWSPTASMTGPRQHATATRLVSGKVLIAGGYAISTGYLQSVEIYDPSSSPPVWTTATPMSSKRGNHTATLLPNGKVLLTGGWSAAMVGSASAEVYDPGTNFWAAVGSMSAVRIAHTATLLGNGKVLLAGGFNYGIPFSTYHSSAELYNPAATTWGSVTSMSHARIAPTATLLNDGRVLVTGGDSLGTRTELYDPATGTWAAGPSMGVGRQYHTATLLGNGKVLVVGIKTVASPANAQLFDPATDTWSSVGSSTSPDLNRKGHTATLLPNGKVVVYGGVNPASAPDEYLSSSGLFNPANNTWSTADDMPIAHAYHAATLLPNGKVLFSGGRSEHVAQHAVAALYELDLWTAVDHMERGRAYHTLTLLNTGEVLAVGGCATNATPTVEVYNPTSDLWSSGTEQFSYRSHTATLLHNGKVLLAGGINSAGNVTRNVYIYDPATGDMDLTGQMNDARYAHAAVRLGNGKVLVVGGSDGSALLTAEIYTP